MAQLTVFFALLALGNIPLKCEAKCLAKPQTVSFGGFMCETKCEPYVSKEGVPQDKNIVTCEKTDIEFGIPTGTQFSNFH